jgi:hypothetical protein
LFCFLGDDFIPAFAFFLPSSKPLFMGASLSPVLIGRFNVQMEFGVGRVKYEYVIEY